MDPDFDRSCVPASRPHSRSGSMSSESRTPSSSSSLNRSQLGPPWAPPALNMSPNIEGEGVRTPRPRLALHGQSRAADESKRGARPEDTKRCARCKSKFFINLKLPCGRVVYLCPSCTSDFRAHLGKKINEVHCLFLLLNVDLFSAVSVRFQKNDLASACRWSQDCLSS